MILALIHFIPKNLVSSQFYVLITPNKTKLQKSIISLIAPFICKKNSK